MKTKKLLPLILLLFIFVTKSIAQKEGDFWFFGNNAGLDFNSGTPVALTVGALVTSEGCAAISDADGNLLFYTDGISVWNKLHSLMPDGTGLLGDPSSTQSGIIVPKPGSTSIYYIFTTAAQGASAGLCYSEVDMTLDGGLGDVTATKNIALYTPVTEKLTAVKNSNGVDFWVVAHDNNTADFLVYAVTSGGVTVTPIISTTGTIDTSTLGIGYLKASADGSKLVSVMDFMNTVDILNFNTTTGDILLDFTFTPIFVNPYGGEFSPNGTRLYIASESSANIYQYDMTLGSSAAIIASATLIGTSSNSVIGALQNAPDKKMYFARYSTYYIGSIDYPDSLGVACHFVDSALYLAGEQNMLGLPNFIPNFFIGSPFRFANTCMGDTTFFSLQNAIVTDSVHWNFGDPLTGINNTSNLDSTYHIFSGTGDFNVSLITYLGSVSDTSISVVHISGPPHIFIGNDTAICRGDTITINAGSGYTYLWQNGTTGQTLRALSAGTYYVTATGLCGTDSDTMHIASLPSPNVAVNDAVLCAGQTANLVATGADSYEWSGGISATGPSVSVSPVITTIYIVKGTGASCSARDTATVTVNPLPVPAITASVTSGCAPLCVQFNETGSATCVNQSYLFGNGDSTSASSPLYCYQDPGTFTVKIFCTDANGCKGSTTVTNMIQVLISPVAHFSVDPTGIISTNHSATFSDASTNAISIIWDFDDPSSGPDNTSSLSSVVHIYKAQGLYCVKEIATNADGCADTSSLCVNVVDDIFIPNVFTPNGDNENDKFYIKNLHLGVAKCDIYNRWGNLVYSSQTYNNDWDGGGESDGVYYYTINYPDNGKIYTGFVQILQSR